MAAFELFKSDPQAWRDLVTESYQGLQAFRAEKSGGTDNLPVGGGFSVEAGEVAVFETITVGRILDGSLLGDGLGKIEIGGVASIDGSLKAFVPLNTPNGIDARDDSSFPWFTTFIGITPAGSHFAGVNILGPSDSSTGAVIGFMHEIIRSDHF